MHSTHTATAFYFDAIFTAIFFSDHEDHCETAQCVGNVIITKAEEKAAAASRRHVSGGGIAGGNSLQNEVKCEIEAVKRSNPASSIYHRACTPEEPDRLFTATPIPRGSRFRQGSGVINHVEGIIVR